MFIRALALGLALVLTAGTILSASAAPTTPVTSPLTPATPSTETTTPAAPVTGKVTTEIAGDDKTKDTPKSTGDAELDAARALLTMATPEQRAALEDLYAQLDAIEQETEIAAEEYNAAHIRLDQINTNIASAQRDYTLISEAFTLQSEKLGSRASDLYRGGGDNTLRLLLGATSLTDLYSRLRYLTELSNIDADMMARIRGQKEQLETKLHQLQADQAEAASLEFELKARKIEVTARNEDRTKELEDQNRELLLLFEAGRTEENATERQLAFEITTGALKNVRVEAGSPAETALAYRGIPYHWGGASKSGFDCSGLVLYVFAQHGVKLPHHSASQALQGKKVTGLIQPNDVVFFGSPIHHVGIYLGDGYYIHAPRTGDVVKISKLNARRDLSAVRRYDWTVRTGSPL